METFSVNNVKCSSILKKLYKTLSEVKLEVETVIKTGRHIVQKQQTDNPKGMDEQLTFLKVLYNDLGAQVGHCSLSLFLSLYFSISPSLDSYCIFILYMHINNIIVGSYIDIYF